MEFARLYAATHYNRGHSDYETEMMRRTLLVLPRSPLLVGAAVIAQGPGGRGGRTAASR